MQIEKIKAYHMTIPQVFCHKEDLWTPPQEKYAGEQIQMKPYHILMRLPDEEDLQYLLMTPFTPSSKDNMVAWVAAKSEQLLQRGRRSEISRSMILGEENLGKTGV
jgi:uncharacterized membrane protein (UPF0182 family)